MRDSSDDIHELLQRGFRYALSLTHDEAQADDLLQDAWLSLLSAGGPHQRSYLFAAIRSRFIDSHRRERLVVFEPLADADELKAKVEAPNYDDALIASDNTMLNHALAMLRPAEREVLLLADVEGYTAREIADLMGHLRGTILSLIHRTRRKLRALLEQPEEESLLS